MIYSSLSDIIDYQYFKTSEKKYDFLLKKIVIILIKVEITIELVLYKNKYLVFFIKLY